ncbi:MULTISPECIES: hypothetical protein [unclassified Rhizobium]|uniref:hypothetical protein n=1 Tax=unclassified Rhizobium TaxID=2613769 RepID=UPI00177FCC98|nr:MULTISPECIES: hypothetical protein [unclassified Rhizobium]MBD8687600.1 hypothetical protein [Rhizobium sp. CFBP 13644]MBD8692054.1 hypothetical protein [Rhizobium sp. CFBP 13717]
MSDTYPHASNAAPTEDNTPNDALSGSVDAPLVDMALQQVAEQETSIGNTVAEDIAVLRAEVESVSQRAGEMQERMISSAMAGAETTARSARDTARQFPLVSLGLAVALGFLAGVRASR